MAISPVPAFPALSDRATGTYNSKAFAWASHMANTFAPEVNALTANLNSIAAGGAYAIPYVLAGPGIVGSDAGGRLFLNDYQSLAVDTKDAGGRSVAALLASFTASTSSIKGTLKIVAQTDPSRWLVYNVTNYVQDAGGRYGYISVVFVNGSDGTNSPLLWGEAVILKFTRVGDKGDKGDKGDSATTAIIRVRDDRSAGIGGDAAVATTWATRTLNSTLWNNIAGASLSGNQITLPAGTYDYVGSAPAFQTNAHQMRLYNVTAGGAIDYGTNEFASSSTNVVTRSIVRGRITLAATTVIAMQHWASSAGSFGVAALTGTIQSYAELTFEKVA